jgi:hypothetical protein
VRPRGLVHDDLSVVRAISSMFACCPDRRIPAPATHLESGEVCERAYGPVVGLFSGTLNPGDRIFFQNFSRNFRIHAHCASAATPPISSLRVYVCAHVCACGVSVKCVGCARSSYIQ